MEKIIPIKLKHNRVKRPFKGGFLLDCLQGIEYPEDAYEAESWIASATEVVGVKESAHYGLSQAIAEGEVYILRDLIHQHPEAYLGTAHREKFGIETGVLVKLIDSYNRLLIQVHPTKAYAKAFLGSDYGKTEAWHMIDTRIIDRVEPHIFVGFKEGITREIWKELFEKQDIKGMLKWLHRIPVKVGDTIGIPSGVPHAVGSGCLLVEIQEPTDYTMRVERKRLDGVELPEDMLHNGLGIEKMLDCFHYDGVTEEEILKKCFLKAELIRDEEDFKHIRLIDSSYEDFFSMDKYYVNGTYKIDKTEQFAIIVIIEGSGEIVYEGGKIAVQKGDELFIPASNNAYVCIGEKLELTQCYPPRA